MDRLKSLYILHWIIVSNFNEVLRASEKEGGRRKEGKLIENFYDIVNDCNLVDVGFSGDK